MKFFILFFIFSLFSFVSFSQQKALSEDISIEWKPVQTINVSENFSNKYLSFQNAIYDFKYGKLPIYYKRFPLPLSNFKTSSKIINDKYIELTPEEVSVLEDSDIIKSDVLIETKLTADNKKPFVDISILPVRKNEITGKYEKLISFELDVYLEINEDHISMTKARTYTANSVLSTGNIYKLSVTNTGIHKITYDDLVNMGIDVNNINPQNIRIYGNGNGMLPESNSTFRYDDLFENAIYVEGESDGVFNQGDYILFYALSPIVWTYSPTEKRFVQKIHAYSDENCYFLTTDHGAGKRIEIQNSLTDTPTQTINTFNDYLFHEYELTNLINTGSQWFGELFDLQTDYSFDFNFPNIVAGSKVKLKTSLVARSTGSSSTFNVNANGNTHNVTILAVPESFTSDYAREITDTISFNAGSTDINIDIKYNKPTNNSLGWLDYIQLNALSNLSFTGTQMSFRNVSSVGTGAISEFVISNASNGLRVWDITNPFVPKYQEFNLTGNNLNFNVHTDSLKEFIAYDGQNYFSPKFIGKVPNQNLHGLGQYDFIIVTAPTFVGEAQRLATEHYNVNNLSTVVVTTDQVYNEFSSGVRDATAIRDFAKMFYDRASNAIEMPKYLLLFGDGSYDNKNRVANNTNFIPTYESFNSLQPTASYVTDDYFGLFDTNEGENSDGVIDIGIGRFPVKTAAEAKNVVDKSIMYLAKQNLKPNSQSGQCSTFSGSISNYGDWRNVICFVADDEDGNLHISQAESLASIVDTTDKRYNIDKIYLDAYLETTDAGGQRYPEVNEAISNRVEKGALIINYTGHGGEEGWAHERVLTIDQINGFKNKYNLPVFVTATCEFSRFDNPAKTSAGELLLLNPNGGGIALLTTTRVAFANVNFSLNKSFYNYALDKINNEYPTLGDLMKHTKNSIGNVASARNFVLLGDPALKMVYPEFNVVTTSFPDTMRAMSKVTITGYIADDNGNVLNDFNGTVYPTVFDKPSYINTLVNDPESAPFTFKLQKNILFKGKARVVNGYFSFDFIVPRDIAYIYDNGKISYYAEDGTRDAKGYFDGFIIGGFDENYTPDTQGPEIRLFMNDTSFVFGGITNKNPNLLAILVDSNGINTTGNGIGHDLTTILDDNNKIIILNDFYESDLNSYQKGRVVYPFYNLDIGLHNLKLKVWDVQNNSSEAYIEFYVTDSEEMAIKNLYNYPNPFRDKTSFIFEHNQTCSELTVEIQIFSMSGQLVKTIESQILSSGFRTEPIEWNGTNNMGAKLNSGLYLYKLLVKNCDGLSAEKTEKLILLK